jgi:protein-S-isoprenylcysteine O-methyltransferase Ste14
MANQEDQAIDNAGVRIPPPLIWAVLLLIGLSIDSAWFSLELANMLEMVIGGLILCVAIYIMVVSAPRFKRAGSNIEPWKPTTTIIMDGMYARSRNPIYLAMLIGFAGFAIAAGSIASFALLVVFWAILQFYVVAREERYLEAKFGQEYTDYRNIVRRWL